MKMAFIIYRDVLQSRIENMLAGAGIDFYTEWEQVKGKGHNTEAHLGTRTFPGMNCVRMIAFENEDQLEEVICLVGKLNESIKLKDDMVRIFQVPLERVI